MSSISSFSSSTPAALPPTAPAPETQTPILTSAPGVGQRDQVELSPAARAILEAGRIAVNAKSGALTSGQAKQLFSQLSTIGQQISADKQANGGSLTQADQTSIASAQNQFGQQIYSDSHAGSTNTNPQTPFTSSDARQIFQAGRLVYGENNGTLDSTQVSQLSAQIAATDTTVNSDLQASGGTLTASQAQAIAQLQNQVSAQIYQAGHPSGTSDPQNTVSPSA